MGRRMVLLVVAIVMAVLGAGLVYAYAQGAEDRATDRLDSVDRVVATGTIEPGERFSDLLSTGRLDVVQVPRTAVLDGSTDAPEDFAGMVATTRIFAGEQLIMGRFGDVVTPGVPAGMVPVSLELDGAERGAFTQPGTLVSIYLTPTSGATSVGTIDDALVVAIGSYVMGPDGPTLLELPGSEEISSDLVTVALAPADAADLREAVAEDSTDIRMASLEPAEFDGGTAPEPTG